LYLLLDVVFVNNYDDDNIYQVVVVLDFFKTKTRFKIKVTDSLGNYDSILTKNII